MKSLLGDALKLYGNDKELLGSFLLENDSITDTLFIHRKRKFIYGRCTYYSVVHGGMRRPDGSSNSSGGHGVHMHYPMYAVRLNPSLELQKVHQEFTTDYNGYFLLEVPSGNYGIFPQHFNITHVTGEMGHPEYKSTAC